MHKVIHKFGPLHPNTTNPFYGRPVHVGFKDEMGGEELYMWCEVDMESPEWRKGFTRLARFIPTGYETYGEDETYVGTAIKSNGTVWHVLYKEMFA